MNEIIKVGIFSWDGKFNSSYINKTIEQGERLLIEQMVTVKATLTYKDAYIDIIVHSDNRDLYNGRPDCAPIILPIVGDLSIEDMRACYEQKQKLYSHLCYKNKLDKVGQVDKMLRSFSDHLVLS